MARGRIDRVRRDCNIRLDVAVAVAVAANAFGSALRPAMSRRKAFIPTKSAEARGYTSEASLLYEEGNAAGRALQSRKRL
ncbi:hypothetical protein EX530_15455 [Xanthomonas phaseoli]|nr:hypothetical protein XANMN_11265 [Xanthomonas phaseoli pv. manihotis str. CIO151]